MYRHKKIVKLELEVYARLTWSLFSRNCREQNDGCDRVSVMTDLNTPHKTKDIFGFEDDVAMPVTTKWKSGFNKVEGNMMSR